MYAFNYHRPKSLDDAAKAVAEAEDGKIIAGGMTLLPSMKLRLAAPSDLVDLAAIDGLKGIKVDGKTVTIGAMTRHVEVQTSADVKKAIPALAALAGGIGDPSVRNRGTIGGSVANSDPAADYPSAVLGLGATVETNKRKIAGDEFFTGLFETALEPGEIIKAIHFPVPDAAAYEKFEQPASGFAMVGCLRRALRQGRARRHHRRQGPRVPRARDGEGAGRQVRARIGRRHPSAGRRHAVGHPLQRRLPRAPLHGDREACRGQGRRLNRRMTQRERAVPRGRPFSLV